MSEFRFPWFRSGGKKESAQRPGTTEVVRADLALSWLSEAWNARVCSDAGFALGRALAGDRVSLWLTDGAGSALGTLSRAAATRVPLLAWVAVRDTAELPSLAATGALVAVARSNQDLVDLSLELRWASERSLLPAIVAYESRSLGQSVQDFVLPDLAEVRRLFQAPGTRRDSSGHTEEVLFGTTRAAVPGWFDLDRPLGTDGRAEGASGAAGRLAARLYLDGDSGANLDGLVTLGLETDPVWVGGRADAPEAVVLCGALTEDILGTPEAQDRRIVALRHLAPFPAAACARALEGARTVVVWSAEPEPSLLSTWIGDALRMHGNEKSTVTHWVAGVGEVPLRPTDVAEAFARIARAGKKKDDQPLRSGALLGWDLAPREPGRPHREALHASLRRDHPEAIDRAVFAAEGRKIGMPGSSPAGTAGSPTRALRVLARPGLSYLHEIGGLLHGLLGGHVRSRQIETALGPRELLVALPENEPVDWAAWAQRSANADIHLPDDILPLLEEKSGTESLEALPVWQQDARILGTALAVFATRRPELADSFGERSIRSLLAQRLQDHEPEEKVRRTEALIGAMNEVSERLEPGESGESGGPGEGGDPSSARDAAASMRAAIRALSEEAPVALDEVTGDGSIIDPARAWQQAVRPWEEDGPVSLVPEPGRIAGARPVLATAFLRSQPTVSSPEALLPTFDMATCTGCAGCWSVCPESAIQGHAGTPAQLFEQALDRAGAAAGPLRRGARQIGQSLTGFVDDSDSASVDPAEGIRVAGRNWVEKTTTDEAEKQNLLDAVEAVAAGAAGLARGRTEVFWDESLGKNRALLALAVDPDACTSCGLCAAVCEPGSVLMGPREAGSGQGWSELQEAGDTPGAILHAVEEKLGTVPARLLSRYVTQSFAGRRDLPGSLGALSLRWVVSAVEAVHQPRVIEFRQSLASLNERLGERIRGQLADSVPMGDLGALAAAISGAGKDADLEAVAHGLRSEERKSGLDGSRLARIVEVARRVQDLRWKEDTGSLGAGRARLGLVTTPGVEWLSRFPSHPAFAPLRAETAEDAVGVWAGLVASHAERTGREAALCREAERLVTTRDAEPAELDSLCLSWDELTPEERRVIPPIVLVAREEELASRIGEIGQVLRGGAPAAVVALSQTGETELSPWTLLAATGRGAGVVQSSAACHVHLDASLSGLLEAGLPFFVRLLAPEPEEGAVPRSAYDEAVAAVGSGRYPLFSYVPGGPFAEALTIDPASLAQAQAHEGDPAWVELWPWVPVSPAESGDIAPSEPSVATQEDLERVRRETEAALVQKLTDRLAHMWRTQRKTAGASNGTPAE